MGPTMVKPKPRSTAVVCAYLHFSLELSPAAFLSALDDATRERGIEPLTGDATILGPLVDTLKALGLRISIDQIERDGDYA